MQAIERMRREIGSESDGREVRLEFMHLDLASLSSAKQFAMSFQEKNLPLHILINNAGIAWVPLGKLLKLDCTCALLNQLFCSLEKSEDGYELHLQVCLHVHVYIPKCTCTCGIYNHVHVSTLDDKSALLVTCT